MSAGKVKIAGRSDAGLFGKQRVIVIRDDKRENLIRFRSIAWVDCSGPIRHDLKSRIFWDGDIRSFDETGSMIGLGDNNRCAEVTEIVHQLQVGLLHERADP